MQDVWRCVKCAAGVKDVEGEGWGVVTSARGLKDVETG